MATWRPVERADVDGWVAGFSGGFTRRANSVVAVAEPADVPAALARAEALYTARGTLAVFRVDDMARPADLDARLAARGYRAVASTRVLVCDVGPDAEAAAAAAWPTGTTVVAADEPDDAWLAADQYHYRER